MHIFLWIVLLIICMIILTSLISFIRSGKYNFQVEMKEIRFSAEIFYTLLVIYAIVIIGFGLIYLILSFQHITLIEGGELREVSVIGSVIHSFYFSGVTLLTIGYGDITPVGIGRFIALVEALIGYVLPTAFVLKLVQYSQNNRND
ncbi:two pore domain potassium channel family protein [Virgibacillus dakarensis]|uniref:LCTB protein n=1 Tax=Lentibacillus populi TaxID=1827502 RepID=A0A9W5X765_9BACI|nr:MULTISPECIES: potassium channel family protein [Bacillaceae]MBT2217739.1 two pore domain potassium channel family protein [Virgibacillus dakarensis]MTW88094.1 two pore domain potassium channel family protein [Virgibacillus dakarensis]GGB57799.1 LCTB protein [Lentibacillus populi]